MDPKVETWAKSVNTALTGMDARLGALEERQRAQDNTASLRLLALLVVIVLTSSLMVVGLFILQRYL